jgi:hypothetical protein
MAALGRVIMEGVAAAHLLWVQMQPQVLEGTGEMESDHPFLEHLLPMREGVVEEDTLVALRALPVAREEEEPGALSQVRLQQRVEPLIWAAEAVGAHFLLTEQQVALAS